MESATVEHQSLRTAGKLPEELSASSTVEAILITMMDDHLCAKLNRQQLTI